MLVRPVGVALLLVGWACATAASGAGADELLQLRAKRLQKPVKVTVILDDKSKAEGQLTWYDANGFELVDARDVAKVIRWNQVQAASGYDLMQKVLSPRADDEWVQAGLILRHLPDGAPQAEKAFARALRADPKLKPLVEMAKAAPAPDGEPGSTLAQAWPRLSDNEQAQAVADLKRFVAEKPQLRGLSLYETRFFLLYTDLKAAEATKWAQLLDQMYARLCEMFALDARQNLWRGKAFVVVFQNADDFRTYEREVHRQDVGKAAGWCHWHDDGRVYIAFYRQSDERSFAHLLVHEAIHGFTHRYRTPRAYPGWLNEGLAEWMAGQIVSNPALLKWRYEEARKRLREKAVDESLFTAGNPPLPLYCVAENFCAFLIAQDKQAFVDFLNGIKDGGEPDDSLLQAFGRPRSELFRAYVSTMTR